jgi:hypothetical protein
MKATILLSLFCLLACLVKGQSAPEGTSLRTTKFANRFKDIEAMNRRSTATVNNKVTPPDKPIRETIFKNYKPGTPNAGSLNKRVSTTTLPSDSKEQKGKDSVKTKAIIPNQGNTAPRKN